jgi:carbonic anhydrase
MSPLTIKAQSLKFESKIPWSRARRPKKPRKAQEDHLKEGKPQWPTKGTKSDNVKQNGKEELRKAQKSKKISNSRHTLKISTKAQKQYSPLNQLPLTLSM